MADDLDERHRRVALDLLVADVQLRVHDGKVPDAAVPPYVLVYTSIERPREGAGNALDGLSPTYYVTWSCHCVGESAAAATAVAMRVSRALVDVRPAITGRFCGLIRAGDVTPPTRDETTGRLVMDSLAVYTLTTTA